MEHRLAQHLGVVASAVALSALIALCGVFGVMAPTSFAYADPSTEEELAAAQAELEAAEAHLQSLAEQLESASNELYRVQQQQAELEAQIEQTKEEIARTQAELDAATSRLNATVVAQYRTRAGTLSDFVMILTQSSSVGDLMTGMYYTQEVSNAQQEDIVAYREAREQLEVQQTELEAEKAELDALVEQARARQADLQSALNQQQSYYQGLSSQVTSLMEQRDAEQVEEARRSWYVTRTNAGLPTYDDGTYETVVEAAASRIGCPYVWAAAGPDMFDCSGLVMWAYAKVGVELPHYSGAQYDCCTSHFTDMSQAQPGDLVFFVNSSGVIHHVGLYVGDGKMIEAPYTGASVRYADAMRSSFLCFGRL